MNKKLLQKIISMGAERAAFGHFSSCIEVSRRYRPGERSKGYRWGELYRGQRAIRHEFDCPRLATRICELRTNRMLKYSNIERVLDRDMSSIELPIDLGKLMEQLQPKHGVKCEIHRKNVIHASGSDIQAGRFGTIHTSSRTGRVHCSINRLCSILRNDLQIDGMPTLEIDLASSQPYFLATLFPLPQLREAVSRGEFYVRINELLPLPINFENKAEYSCFKQSILSILYARPVHGYDYTEAAEYKHTHTITAFEQAYPGISTFLKKYRKTYGDIALPIAMQRLESRAFINGALKKLQSMEIPAIPIHDSILCRICDANCVEAIIRECLLEQVQIAPTLRKSKIA